MKPIIAGAMLGFVLFASAQAQSPAPTPGSNKTIPEKTAPPDTDLGKQDGSLSHKLNSSNGVIHPDGGVDPKMQKSAPPTEPMPVVPAPGSPGGRSDLQPK